MGHKGGDTESETRKDRPGRTRVSAEVARAIVRRHNLGTRSHSLRPWVGSAGSVYPLGDDLVLKVPHHDPAGISSARVEALAVPAVRTAGVRTPPIIAFDDSLDLLPVPYAVFERVRGEPLDRLGVRPESVPGIWRELGRDLALVHTGVSPDDGPLDGLARFEQSPEIDPRRWVEEAASAGCFASARAEWLIGLLDRLAPAALAPLPACFCHGDANASNVMAERGEYAALLDWGGSGWMDPAWDLSGIPLRAVPHVLQGHREVAPLEDDTTAEARVLWSHLQLALFGLRHTPCGPEHEGRVARLLRDARHFLNRSGMG